VPDGVHAFVKNTHDIDTVIRRQVEDQMLAGRVDAKRVVHFIASIAELRVSGELLTGARISGAPPSATGSEA